MKMGLVGYAGTGKSTVFEWLTGEKPDPSKVQQGQTAMADVPDERLAKIAAVLKPKKTTYTKVAVLDTPGLDARRAQGQPAPARRHPRSQRHGRRARRLLAHRLRRAAPKFREELLFADLEIVSNRIAKLEARA